MTSQTAAGPPSYEDHQQSTYVCGTPLSDSLPYVDEYLLQQYRHPYDSFSYEQYHRHLQKHFTSYQFTQCQPKQWHPMQYGHQSLKTLQQQQLADLQNFTSPCAGAACFPDPTRGDELTGSIGMQMNDGLEFVSPHPSTWTPWEIDQVAASATLEGNGYDNYAGSKTPVAGTVAVVSGESPGLPGTVRANAAADCAAVVGPNEDNAVSGFKRKPRQQNVG
jgi:hypothetical protein